MTAEEGRRFRRERRPRVLFAIGTLEAGGSECQLVELASRIHGSEVDVTVLTLGAGEDPRLTGTLRRAGVPRETLRARAPGRLWPIVTYVDARRYLRRLRPELVYAWLEITSLMLGGHARRLGIPVLVARRNIRGATIEEWPAAARLIRAAEARATLVTANSGPVREAAIERGIDPELIRLVSNGHVVPPEVPPPASDEVSIGYLANYRPEKGHFRFLEAIGRLQTETRWRVQMRGFGPLRDEVERAVRSRGLADRVTVGEIDSDPAAFWSRQHIAALASDSEGSPNALIEAALAGRPLVTTDGAGMREVVGPGGVVAPADDPSELARRLAQLIDDPALRERLGARAREDARVRFSIERCISSHLAAIDEALGGRPQPAQ